MDNGMHQNMPSPSTNTTIHHKMMMHMTFYWGKNAEILFSKWPGTSTGMYIVALLFIFILSMSIEWLSHSRLIKQGSSHGLLKTLLHTVRVGLSYLVMLALMSYNGGVFIMAVAGHSIGFLLFGSRVFKQEDDIDEDEKQSDLPPMTC
ncbi:hypothetical protein ACHQM5_028677 [Ranunculus cassubicifolius]